MKPLVAGARVRVRRDAYSDYEAFVLGADKRGAIGTVIDPAEVFVRLDGDARLFLFRSHQIEAA